MRNLGTSFVRSFVTYSKPHFEPNLSTFFLIYCDVKITTQHASNPFSVSRHNAPSRHITTAPHRHFTASHNNSTTPSQHKHHTITSALLHHNSTIPYNSISSYTIIPRQNSTTPSLYNHNATSQYHNSTILSHQNTTTTSSQLSITLFRITKYVFDYYNNYYF